MARVMSPGRHELEGLRTPLTPGEKIVLDFFDRQLPEGWEIYIQPHLNGLRPDFVLLHPRVGIGVFEVKDWDLKAMTYEARTRGSSFPILFAANRGEKPFRVENPLEKVSRYKEQIINLYCPRLGIRAGEDQRFASVVTAGVIMMGTTTAQARQLLDPRRAFQQGPGSPMERYHPIVGGDALAQDALRDVFPTAHEYAHKPSQLMNGVFAEDIRSWLVEPDFAEAQRRPLELDARQKDLVVGRNARTSNGYRRIRGPAGSGKSLVLAARAAQLTAEGKDVLVVTYNMTLWHYLRDLAARYPEPNRRICNKITWCHFHEWCKRVCYEAGMEDDYMRLWRGQPNDAGAEEWDGSNEVLEKALPALVARAFATNKGKITQYDAVLVDEGQDFNLTWWNVLRNAARLPEGERLLVADATQDLYEKAEQWTESSMTSAGFAGPWVRLELSYRMPSSFIPYLQTFVKDYLSGIENDPPVSQRRFDLDDVHLRWIQATPQGAAQACVEAVLSMPAQEATATIAFADITLLVESHDFGRQCVNLLQQKGVECSHVFGDDTRQQRRRKLAFYMGAARVKACTIHSFKGWETRTLVVHIANATRASSLAAAYVALSRLKWHQDGSYLTVVCSAPELEAYGRTWPEFSRSVEHVTRADISHNPKSVKPEASSNVLRLGGGTLRGAADDAQSAWHIPGATGGASA